jgi:hypothetical protein
MNLQLWLKYLAAVQIGVVLYCAWVCVSLSNVALVNCLGVRSLTEEEQLYIRLSRLGKHFSTGEEIGTFLQSDLNRALKCCCSSHLHSLSMFHSFLCIHEIYLCIHTIGVPKGVTLLEFEGALLEE